MHCGDAVSELWYVFFCDAEGWHWRERGCHEWGWVFIKAIVNVIHNICWYNYTHRGIFISQPSLWNSVQYFPWCILHCYVLVSFVVAVLLIMCKCLPFLSRKKISFFWRREAIMFGSVLKVFSCSVKSILCVFLRVWQVPGRESKGGWPSPHSL